MDRPREPSPHRLSGRPLVLSPFPEGLRRCHLMGELAVDVRNVSKAYRIYAHPRHRLLEALWRGRRKYHHDFWALRDVTFQVPQGATVGIIGLNGSGKSTLLQVV